MRERERERDTDSVCSNGVIHTLSRYSAALSGLLKLACSALTTLSLSYPICIRFRTTLSYSDPRTVHDGRREMSFKSACIAIHTVYNMSSME